MNFRTIALSAAVLAFAGLVLPACSSKDDSAAAQAASGTCPAVGSKECTNDTATTQQEYDACVAAQSDSKCGSTYTDLLKCTGSNISCDANGKSQLSANCQSQKDAYTKCLATK